MKINAQLLESKLAIKCKGKPVKYHDIKIGRIIGTEMKDGKLYINIKIFKKYTKNIIGLIKKESNISSLQIKG